MTDEQIINALERMSEEDPDGFSNDILDLINRQYTEMDKLNCVIISVEQQLKLASSVIDRQKAEIENFKDFFDFLKYCTIKLYDADVIPMGTIKTQAKAMGIEVWGNK